MPSNFSVGWTPKSSYQFNTGGGGGGGGLSDFRTFRKHAGLPQLKEYDYLSNFKNLLSYLKGDTNPNIGDFETSQIKLPDEYREDPYSFKSVDPEAAIQAAKAPIETEMQRNFAQAGARYGAAGALTSQPYAEFGLGKASARASENIAAMTEQAMLDASKFNRSLEASMEEGRRGRQFGGWQARGGWDVGGQEAYEQRRLGKRGQDIEMALADKNLNYSSIMSILGMQGPQRNQNALTLYNLLENQFGSDAADRAYYSQLFGGMDYGKGKNIMDLMGFKNPPGGGGLSKGAMGGDNSYRDLIALITGGKSSF